MLRESKVVTYFQPRHQGFFLMKKPWVRGWQTLLNAVNLNKTRKSKAQYNKKLQKINNDPKASFDT